MLFMWLFALPIVLAFLSWPLALWEASRGRAQSAVDELETKTRSARAEIYQQMEEKRRAALERRAEIVAGTRREVEQAMADATRCVRAQATAARSQLEGDADALATIIVERVLGRKAS